MARLPAASGAPLWMQQGGASGSGSEIARAVAVGSGGVFVAGETNGELDPDGVAGGMDAFVVKLDAGNGAIVWRGGSGDGTDEAMAIAVAPGGDLYLAGRTAGAIGTAAFDAPSPPPPPMACRNFCLDGSLPVSYRCTSQAKFCEGCTICGGGGGGDGDGGGGDQGGEDAWVAKVNHDGTVGWIVQFGSGGDDAARAVTADDSRVAVAGSTAGALTPRSRHQAGSTLLSCRSTPPRARWTGRRSLGATRTTRPTRSPPHPTALFMRQDRPAGRWMARTAEASTGGLRR